MWLNLADLIKLHSCAPFSRCRYIGMSVYNLSVVCVVGVPIGFFINDEYFVGSYVISSFFIIIAVTITLCFVFVPKVRTYSTLHQALFVHYKRILKCSLSQFKWQKEQNLSLGLKKKSTKPELRKNLKLEVVSLLWYDMESWLYVKANYICLLCQDTIAELLRALSTFCSDER